MLDQSYCLSYLRIDSVSNPAGASTHHCNKTYCVFCRSHYPHQCHHCFWLQEMLAVSLWQLTLSLKRDYFPHGTLIGYRGVSLGIQWWKFSLTSLESSIFLTSLLFLVPAKTVICVLEQSYMFIFLESVEYMGSHSEFMDSKLWWLYSVSWMSKTQLWINRKFLFWKLEMHLFWIMVFTL